MPQSGYGMTETCSHQYTLPDDAPDARSPRPAAAPARATRSASGARTIPTSRPRPGEIGQIGGRGASLMLGYFDDQAATEAAFNAHGWFMTGDLGWLDDDGYLRITGRKKDVIIRGGHNIYPARIEALAMRHPAVERVAAASPSRTSGSANGSASPWCAREGAPVDAEQVLAPSRRARACRATTCRNSSSTLEQMPLTASGKIRKRDIVDWIEEGRASPRPVRWKPGTRET